MLGINGNTPDGRGCMFDGKSGGCMPGGSSPGGMGGMLDGNDGGCMPGGGATPGGKDAAPGGRDPKSGGMKTSLDWARLDSSAASALRCI